VEKIATTFLSVAVLKALGGYKQPAPKPVTKARNEPLPNTMRGAVEGALIRSGIGVEKANGPTTEQRRAVIQKSLEDEPADMRGRIARKARELGTEIK